jgi:hypothetical protein
MKKLPKDGSRWNGGNGLTFRVQHTVETDGNTWVHYIRENDATEYSCFLESFLSRFVALPE